MMSDRGVLGLSDAEREFIGYLRSLGQTMGILPEKVTKGRPAVPRRVRKAARYCEAIADTYGVYVPNEPFPERLRKADPIQKVKPHFTNTEIREMGLKWVTVHPNGAEPGRPVLVQDLGDEYVVVGGAGGSMNFTRFKKDKQAEPGAKPKKPKKEKPELSEEERAAQEAKLADATQQTKEAKSKLRARIAEIIGGTPEIPEEQRKELEAKALAEAKRRQTTEEGQRDFVQQALKQHEDRRKEATNKAIDEAIAQVNEAAGVEALTGQPVEPPDFTEPEDSTEELTAGDGEKPKRVKPARLPITPEQFKEIKRLVAEAANAVGYERSIKRALNKGGEAAARALELHYKPLSEEEQEQYFADRHLEHEKMRANKALLDATANPNKAMTSHILAGAADAGAGIAAAACGTTVLDSQTAKELGTAGSAQVIAQYIADKTGSPAKAAKALREFIGTQSAATAGAAVKASMDLAERADAMIEAAKGQGLLNGAQANAKVLQYRNEADRILGRALGSLETAAQVALNLERPLRDKLVVRGRGSETATLQLAQDLGLANSEGHQAFEVVKTRRWELHITPEGIRDLYREQSIEQYQADAEVQEIKERGRNEGWVGEDDQPWAVDGQSPDFHMRPHQQANIRLWDRQKNLLVADEAGSGKTATAILGIRHLASQGKVKKALVVVPTTVAKQFEDEMKDYLLPEHHGDFVVATGMARSKRHESYGGDQLITVITHDTLRNDFEQIKAAGFDCLNVDEAHEFVTRGKKEDTKGSLRAQKARQLDVPYKMLMTGSPVRNDLSELWSLADWMQPGCLGTRTEFMNRYGKLASSKGAFDEAMRRSLQQRLSSVMTGITLSVEKDEGGETVLELQAAMPKAGKPLPAPIRCREHTVWSDLSPEQQRVYQQTETDYREKKPVGDIDPETGEPKEGSKPMNPMTRDQVHKRTVNNIETENHPKVAKLRDILANHPGERAVIFAQNGYSHTAIIEGLGLKKGEYAIINGDTPSERRKRIAAALNDPESPVKHVICSDAANFGLNMQGASVLVNWDASDTYATHRQRIGREFRGKQTRDVSVYNLRTNTPFERTAQERIQAKKQAHDLSISAATLDESGLYSIFADALGSGT